MELQKVSELIEQRIKLLETGRQLLQERATTRAEKTSNYEKNIALTLIKLKNGVEMEIDGEKIQNPPTSIMEKLAKGLCWKEKLEMETAETKYKIAIIGLQSIQAEMNALQSILKYMEEL